jgi:hypothetical protein
MARRAMRLSWGIPPRDRIFFDALAKIVRHTQSQRVHQPITRKAERAIEQHLPTLVRKRAQLLSQDAYGKWILDDWKKEIEYFIAQQIEPLLTREEQSGFVETLQAEIADMIYSRVEWESIKNPFSRTFSDTIAPNEF